MRPEISLLLQIVLQGYTSCSATCMSFISFVRMILLPNRQLHGRSIAWNALSVPSQRSCKKELQDTLIIVTSSFHYQAQTSICMTEDTVTCNSNMHSTHGTHGAYGNYQQILDGEEDVIWWDSLACDRWRYLPQLLEIILCLWDLTKKFVWY